MSISDSRSGEETLIHSVELFKNLSDVFFSRIELSPAYPDQHSCAFHFFSKRINGDLTFFDLGYNLLQFFKCLRIVCLFFHCFESVLLLTVLLMIPLAVVVDNSSPTAIEDMSVITFPLAVVIENPRRSTWTGSIT